MGETTGEGLAVIYDTSQTGYAPIATGNNNLVSTIIDCRYAKQFSVQLLTDGGAKVNWNLQVTDIPPSVMNYGRTIFGAALRDDTFASAMWSTVNSGQLAAGGSMVGTIVTFPTSVHRAARMTFNWDASNAGGSSAKLFACVLTLGAG